MTVIRDCTYLVRVDEGYRLAHGDIVVRDKIIAEITKPNVAPVAGQPVMLGTGCLVVPGFVNAHTHSPLNVLRGTVDGMDHVGFMWTNQADTAGRSEDELTELRGLAETDPVIDALMDSIHKAEALLESIDDRVLDLVAPITKEVLGQEIDRTTGTPLVARRCAPTLTAPPATGTWTWAANA